ncbi:MAG: DNA topoisomerase IB [Actinobacteria bacterium]|nr:DNA topoisomerase IB [Actinomycetota bacterium]
MRLRRSDPSIPGIARRGRGRGFEYFWPLGDKITDAAELDRLRGLAIPPAWRDVWICVHHNGHLQAIGTDAAGRRQYLYHPRWRERRDAVKFDHMLEFARALPDLRAFCVEVLEGRDGLDRERVLACAVRLLDHGFFRIGTERAVDDDDAVGLTTMHKDHVTVRSGGWLEFDYPAKSGKRRVAQLSDPAVVDVVGRLRRRRTGGHELLAYRSGGRWVDVTASDVNELIKQHCGQDSSAKDFRTWNATVLAAVAVAVNGAVEGASRRKRVIARACAEVAHYLGNTPTVARNSYIDPRVFDRFASGWVIDVLAAADDSMSFGVPAYQGELEKAVLDLLADDTDAAGVITRTQLLRDLRQVG